MTTTEQLFNKLKFLKNFLGVFPRDNLPAIKFLPVSLIMNTDPHNKPGQHWVAIHINSDSCGIYFDSYGLPPLNQEFIDYLNDNCNSWTYNKTMIQGYNSLTCGQYCALFVLLQALGYDLFDIIHLFCTDFKTNDEIVQEFFRNL